MQIHGIGQKRASHPVLQGLRRVGCERGVAGGLREMRGASGDVQMREMRARMGAEEAHGGREQAAEGVPGVQIAVLVQGARPIRGGREMMRVTAMNGDGVLAMAMLDRKSVV